MRLFYFSASLDLDLDDDIFLGRVDDIGNGDFRGLGLLLFHDLYGPCARDIGEFVDKVVDETDGVKNWGVFT